MLRRLTVENYALIEKLNMELGSGLNIVTGETGAGKSILLGALGLILGSRTDTAALKDNSHNCVVEGEFEIAGYGLESFFADNDLDYSDQTTIRRIVAPNGKSRAYVNDLPIQIAQLKELGARLIDIHSQHQTLMLGNEDFRTRIVDVLADDGALLQKYVALYADMHTIEQELRVRRDEVARIRRDEEYLRFQYEQLASMNLRDGEVEELETEQSELSNTEQIGETVASAAASLGDEQTGVAVRLKAIEQALHKIKDVYPSAAEMAERVHTAAVDLRDAESFFASEYERIEANPERLEKVVARLDAIYSLQQKHRVGSVAELMALRDEFADKLSLIDNSANDLSELEQRLLETTKAAKAAAAKLSAARSKAAAELDKKVSAMLARLGMEGACFKAVIAPAELGSSGADLIDFLFASSSKLAPQPLERIASGGETSRVMLALKALVARNTKLPTIVFDEIDTGVSGRIADAMGAIIAELASTMQVVNITHLPQIASKGETHFRVYKDSEGRTQIGQLSAEERVVEIAKMLSGTTVTEEAVAQARRLLQGAK